MQSGKPSDLVQGTLDMLVLKTLALEPMHGYGIAVRLEQMSKGVFRLNAGSLFVAFQRLQRAGLIRSEWKAIENSRRAKYYVLTDQGPSLTTPAVSRVCFSFFLFLITELAHTSPFTHEACLFRVFSPHLWFPNLLSPFPFINSVLPTKHLFDHHRP